MTTRLRQLGPVGLVLVLTVVGFFATRAHGEADARHDSIHRADIASTRVRDQVAQAATLVDGVRRFLVSPDSEGATEEQFVEIGARWLAPVGLPAAAWIERVPGSGRASYERRTGRLIVVPTSSGGIHSADLSATYLPATLVTASPPLTSPGVDLGSVPGIEAAVARPETAYRVSATPLTRLPDGTNGLFLVQSAQRLNRGAVEPGFVVLFLPASWLLAGATDTAGPNPGVQVAVGGPAAGDVGNAATVESTFAAAGQTFAVRVIQSRVHGAAAVQPWLVGATGLMLAVLAGALRVIAARRRKAKAELDRLFAITPDLIVVAGFDGYFKRVNPAFHALLGHTEAETLGRPYLDFVHPADRARTIARRQELRVGEATEPIENRYVCRDGSYRWIEWTAIPVHEEQLSYAVGRDVTDRRQTQAEQAALRRVATLVAGAVSPSEVFAGTAAEIRRLIGSDFASLGRYESDGTLTNLAHDNDQHSDEGESIVGTRVPINGESAAGVVLRTGCAARMSFDTATGPVADLARSLGVVASVGAPIVVEGRLWGVIVVSTKDEALPADTERRLADFTELVATGIADAESRAALGRLAEQQAALRRVATLVAEGVAPAEVFSALAQEVSQLLDAEATLIGRLESDGKVAVVAISGLASDEAALGTAFEPNPDTVIAAVIDSGRSMRKDEYGPMSEPARSLGIRSGVGVPIVVDGALWGVVAIGTRQERFADDTEQRLDEFTQLAATAIANTESRAESARLIEEQASLRRVATLVARGTRPADIFSAVAEEVGRVMEVESTSIVRFETDGTLTVVAISGVNILTPAGSNWPLDGDSVAARVYRTDRPARMNSFDGAEGVLAELARELGRRSGVGAPIRVDDRLWGAAIANSKTGVLPAVAEERLAKFAELVAMGISNAETRTELTASRARVVAAADETRRRIERDLHDGIQQRLVSLALQARAATRMTPRPSDEVQDELTVLADQLNAAFEELREISRGIHPAILSEAGLSAALKTLARRSPVPVALDLNLDSRLEESIEVAAYYIASEALTNAVKHAQASVVELHVDCSDGVLTLVIRDDGMGGADPAGGSGLIGLKDRVEALGGTIAVSSPPGRGTSLRVVLPVDSGVAPTSPPAQRSAAA